MGIKLKFDSESHHRNDKLSQKEANSIVLYKDNWNDYGYQVTFDAFYYDKDEKEFKIGSYEIYCIEPNSIKNCYSKNLDWEKIILCKEPVKQLKKIKWILLQH